MSNENSRINPLSAALGLVIAWGIIMLIGFIIRCIFEGIRAIVSYFLERRAEDRAVENAKFEPIKVLPGRFADLVYSKLPVENKWLLRYTTYHLTIRLKKLLYDRLSNSAEGYEFLAFKMKSQHNDFAKNLCNEIVSFNLNKHKTFGQKAQKVLADKIKEINKLIFAYNMPEVNSVRVQQVKKFFKHRIIEFPVDNSLGMLYDNFNIVVITKDNKLCLTPKKLEKYEELSKQERLQFVKENLDIEALFLYHPDLHFRILIEGFESDEVIFLMENKHLFNEKSFSEKNLLTEEDEYDISFVNFQTLRLADLDSIENNDIRQFFQSKVDFSKESMAKLAGKKVRGDDYKLFLYNDSSFYIRYVCPSTGRVYYNEIFEDALARSEYFKKDDYDSYIDAWWSMNNMFADPNEENIIRC